MFRSFALAAVVVVASSISCQAEEWRELFNKKDLSGWQAVDGPMDSWYVENGVLKCNGKGGGWLSAQDEYKDFDLELEFRTVPGSNSGVMLRAPRKGEPTFEGMEIQILDDYSARYKDVKPWQRSGSLYGVVPAKSKAAKAPGDWQQMLIRCKDNVVTVELNGYAIVDADLNVAKPVDNHEHPGLERRSGYLGVQNHSTPIEFRAIRIRPL